MLNPDLLASTVLGDISISPFFTPCRPKVLIVTDGPLNFLPGAGFGLSRFVQAISGASPSPIVTLAYRGVHASPVSIYGTNYPVLNGFTFDGNAPAVTVANFDQIWLFGFDAAPAITATEVKKIADFMNAGGGVFATGDHATLGQAMSGQLPRIRHMREWASVPMGLEGGPVARNRIDTVINPGPGGLYEFDDQADEIPQRIYPNYNVTWVGPNWTATIPALLRMPFTPANRTDSSGFTNDMDALPDHPHESICYEVSASSKPLALNGTYNLAGANFLEFPLAIIGGGRIGSQIVAFGVSGGRSVYNNGWKPPVNPRMFGIIAAFDGHAGTAYAGAPTRPGRIVCDSTWHHFVNVNLDGTGTNPVRTGLGIGSGLGFIPSIDLQKIYTYYRNTLGWLQPLNRRLCGIIWDLIAVRYHHALVEELVYVKDFDSPFQFEGLGREAMRLIDAVRGPGSAADAVQAALRAEGSAANFADALGEEADGSVEGADARLVAYVLGRGLAQVATSLSATRLDDVQKQLGRERHERMEKSIAATLAEATGEAIRLDGERAEGRLRRLSALAPSKEKKAGR